MHGRNRWCRRCFSIVRRCRRRWTYSDSFGRLEVADGAVAGRHRSALTSWLAVRWCGSRWMQLTCKRWYILPRWQTLLARIRRFAPSSPILLSCSRCPSNHADGRKWFSWRRRFYNLLCADPRRCFLSVVRCCKRLGSSRLRWLGSRFHGVSAMSWLARSDKGWWRLAPFQGLSSGTANRFRRRTRLPFSLRR